VCWYTIGVQTKKRIKLYLDGGIADTVRIAEFECVEVRKRSEWCEPRIRYRCPRENYPL